MKKSLTIGRRVARTFVRRGGTRPGLMIIPTTPIVRLFHDIAANSFLTVGIPPRPYWWLMDVPVSLLI